MLSNQSIDLKTMLTDLPDEKTEIISGGCRTPQNTLVSAAAEEFDRDGREPLD